MAPKALAKAAAKAKGRAKRSYILRDQRVRAPPPAVSARSAQLLRDMRARPGRCYICPECSYPRFVPHEATCKYCCALPRVRLPSGHWVNCKYRTTSSAWRRNPMASLAHETACKAVAQEIVLHVEAQCEAGLWEWSTYYPNIRREFAERTAVPPPPAVAAAVPPAQQAAAAAQPLAHVPAAE